MLLEIHPDTSRDKVLPQLRVVDITARAQRITVRELERFLSSREGYALRSER